MSVDSGQSGDWPCDPPWPNGAVTLTVIPDKGCESGMLLVTGSGGDRIEVRGRGGGRYTFTGSRCRVTIAAVFVEIEAELPPLADVPEGYRAETAIRYVCSGGLINGASHSTLSPQGQATRAQTAVILIRLCENIAKQETGGRKLPPVSTAQKGRPRPACGKRVPRPMAAGLFPGSCGRAGVFQIPHRRRPYQAERLMWSRSSWRAVCVQRGLWYSR